MEATLVSGLIKPILPKLLSLAEEKYKLHKNIKNDIIFLAKELHMIVGSIDDELSGQTEDLRELAHRIEDCIDSLMYTGKQNKSFLKSQEYARPPEACQGDAAAWAQSYP